MALVPSTGIDSTLMSEVDMGGASDSSTTTVRATVVQASTVFYDTPATIGKYASIYLLAIAVTRDFSICFTSPISLLLLCSGVISRCGTLSLFFKLWVTYNLIDVVDEAVICGCVLSGNCRQLVEFFVCTSSDPFFGASDGFHTIVFNADIIDFSTRERGILMTSPHYPS